MEKKTNKTHSSNQVQKPNWALLDLIAKESEIRIGVAIAEEDASNESKKRRLTAPPSIEEKIFLDSFKN